MAGLLHSMLSHHRWSHPSSPAFYWLIGQPFKVLKPADGKLVLLSSSLKGTGLRTGMNQRKEISVSTSRDRIILVSVTKEAPYPLRFREVYFDNLFHGWFVVITHTNKDSGDYDHLKALAFFGLREQEPNLDFSNTYLASDGFVSCFIKIMF